MPALNAISPDTLLRLTGTASAPRVIDVREKEPDSLLPASVRRTAQAVSAWGPALKGRSVVVVCEEGGAASAGVAALLRHQGVMAEYLEGGAAAWLASGYPTIPAARISRPESGAPSLWVTRARPKVDRIACPWLIRRFVDPDAAFLFVAPAEVEEVAARFGGAAFDINDTYWSHRGERCTFDLMVEALGLSAFPALLRLAEIVRGADTGRLDLAPQAAGLLAASLGLSRIHSDDLEQLDAGMLLYDAFYRWCRDAADEKHDWQSHAPRKGRQ